MNRLVHLIVDSAQKEYGRASKSFFTAWGFFVFAVLVPAAFLLAGLLLERLMGIDEILNLRFEVDLAVRWAIFLPLLVLGQSFILWTVVHQLRFSGGTPAFKAPPKKLLVAGPFRYCRNPMIFGYLTYYYGLAFLFASPIALFGFCPGLNFFALFVIIEIEEVELAQRFGADYLAYKESVNRMIPFPPAWRGWIRQRRHSQERHADPLDNKGHSA